MKLYILRHEDRTKDCTLFSPLTELGLSNSFKLKTILNNENINIIYSSPYIRALQTVYYYSSKHDIKINIETGLGEIQITDILPKKSIGVLLPEYIMKKYNYNCEYVTIVPNDDIKYPEVYSDVLKRTKKILYDIILKYYKTDENILIVTHQTTCKCIINTINKLLVNYSKNDVFSYKKGELTLIFDNNSFLINKIN